MRSVIALCLLAVAGFSAAQEQYNIDPNSVPLSQRQTWCNDQTSQCPLICLQQPGVNTMTTIENSCDPDDLTFSCVCVNNITPNLTLYTQTIPYHECQEWGNQCVAACGQGNNQCADDCRAKHPCGAQDVKKPNSTVISSSSMLSTAAPTSSSTDSPAAASGFLGQTPTSSPNHKGAASSMVSLGQSYGLAVIFAGVFAGFALIL